MQYGEADTTYKAVGCEAGIRQLVGYFYDIMQASYPVIFSLHPSDNNESRDKLARFLSGWTTPIQRKIWSYQPSSCTRTPSGDIERARPMARLYERSARTDGVPSEPTKLPYRATDRPCRANQTSVYG